jgi:acetolactate synthase-1/2/3 large subunit
MNETTGARLLIELLERQGVGTISGIPGGANLPIYDALAGSRRIRHVLARHEQGAGFIAGGIARATGLPGVCLASSGPGATNLLTAIADARLDSVPLVAITGQVPTTMLGTDAFQEVDTYGLSIPITKHNFLVSSAHELLECVPRAFAIAMSGRPGPVLIDIPKNVQTETVAFEAWPEAGFCDVPTQPAEGAIREASALIDGSKRPILYLGGGVIHAEAADEARALAEHAALPIVMTLMALGAVQAAHPLSLGMLGMHGAPYTNHLLAECDLLIAVGARFDDRATGKLSGFCPGARVVHIDIDNAELNKLRTADVTIDGDLRAALHALAERTRRQGRRPWLDRVRSLRASEPMQLPGIGCPRSPYGLIAAVAERLDDDAIITTDVGQHQMWVAQSYPFARPRRWITSGGLGTMGFGLPTAIGAAIAEPDRTVFCFSGDGSILMNIQELATLADLRANVKVLVMNNRCLGLVRQQQALFYGSRIFGSRFESLPDFDALAGAFGIPALDLDTCDDPRARLDAALNEPGPLLIHASIDSEANVYPMVPPGAANTEMIGARP